MANNIYVGKSETWQPLHCRVNIYIGLTLHKGGLKNLRLQNTSSMMDTYLLTWPSWQWTKYTAMIHASAGYNKAGWPGLWGPHILQEWSSGSTLCETCSVTICFPEDSMFPLTSSLLDLYHSTNKFLMYNDDHEYDVWTIYNEWGSHDPEENLE